jgi:hypothetical protein
MLYLSQNALSSPTVQRLAVRVSYRFLASRPGDTQRRDKLSLMMKPRCVHNDPSCRKTTFRVQVSQLAMARLSEANKVNYGLGGRRNTIARLGCCVLVS